MDIIGAVEYWKSTLIKPESHSTARMYESKAYTYIKSKAYTYINRSLKGHDIKIKCYSHSPFHTVCSVIYQEGCEKRMIWEGGRRVPKA